MWDQAEPRRYTRAIAADALVRAMMTAFVARLSGLREIAERMNSVLGTNNFSSLSHALGRPSTLAFVRLLVDHLQTTHAPGKDELVALYIVPPEDCEALAGRMLELAANADLRQRMGQRSAEKIQGHTPEQWAEDFERIVHGLLSRTSP